MGIAKGSSMGWRGTRRSIAAAMRRNERHARARARAATKAWNEAQKVAAKEAARLEVEAFEAQIDELTSLHRECVEPVDWAAEVKRPLPPKPIVPEVRRTKSERAKEALDNYRPGFFERLVGSTSGRQELERRLSHELSVEAAEQRAAAEQHAADMKAWQEAVEYQEYMRDLGKAVLAGDQEAVAAAIDATGCLSELASTLKIPEFAVSVSNDRAELSLTADDTAVPVEQKALTARDKLSVKKLPAGRRVEIYQEYVCGAALRAGREILAVTPLETVLVHVRSKQLDTATGHHVERVILSVICTRPALSGLAWENVVASDLVERLIHRMKVTRGKGFQPVDPLGNTVQSS